MTRWTLCAGAGGLALALLFGSSLDAQSPANPPSDPHHHIEPVHRAPWTTEMAPDVRLVRVRSRASGKDTVVSRHHLWRVFVVFPKDESGGRLRLEAARTGEAYELRGIPLPYRLLSDIVWIDDRYLVFDRWSQPHYGIHYVVDVERRRLVLAAPFPDRQ